MKATRLWRKWSDGSNPSERIQRGSRAGLLMEQLEDRLAPVIGFNTLAPVVARGGDFDGVVNINGCTASLMTSARHIITAAHCVDSDGTTGTLGADGANNVLFEMIRGATPIDININVPAAFIAVQGGWQGNNNIGNGNDVAILRLTDQVNSAINRHLIAPFGAQRYAIFPGTNEVGQNYTIVGYGETGTGNTGQQSDEVQRVSITNPVAGGTFTLTFNGQTTAAIAQNANAQTVAAALRALANIGQDGNGVANVVVNTVGLPANTWDVRFVNQLGYTNVAQLTGGATGGATVNVATQFNGNQPGINGVKHSGQNRYDVTAIGNTALRSDWDNGLAANDAIGGNTGPDTGFAARGDSGGPGFIRNTTLNTWEIATVVSFTQAQNNPPDINNYVDGNGNVRRDNSFGEARTDTRLSSFNGAGAFIPTTIAGNYHLVLDMGQQVLGNDGLTENLTIIARRNGANVEIEVVNNSAPGTFAGLYYTAPVAELLSLTLRGSGDNETFRVEGDLGLDITVDGRGGTDTLQMLNLGSPATYTPDGTNQPSRGSLAAYGDTITFAGMEFVTPVAPDITSFSVAPLVINENGTVTVNGQFIDPGSLSSHEVTVAWGDGTSDTFSLAVGARTFTRGHTYLDDNPSGTPQDMYAVQITVRDNDTLTDSVGSVVTVNNVAPTLSDLAATTIDENGTTTLTGRINDPGTLDTFTVSVNWGDPLSPNNVQVYAFPAGTTDFQLTHQYLDDNPSGTTFDIYTINLVVTDDDTGTNPGSTSVRVNNVAPVITAHDTSAPSGDKAEEGETVTVSGAFTDVGTLDTHTVSIDWGDGTVTAGVVVQGSGFGSFSGGHAYTSGGIFTVTITLTDDDTQFDTAIETVFVTGAGVQPIDGKQVLFIVGTNGNDHVTVNAQGNGTVRVHAGFLPGGQRTFSVPIDEIRMYLCAGDDRGTIAGSVEQPALLDGGAGDDDLNAGGGPAVLLGGTGNDKLIGSKRNDVMIGGTGLDRLVGNAGEDILIGGFTSYDYTGDDDVLAHQQSLLSILAEWNSSRTLTQRRDNIAGVGVGPRLNGNNFLTIGGTVFDDGDEDVFTGSSGNDWFFLFPNDKATDLHGGDLLN